MTERFILAPFTFWLHLIVVVFLIVEALRKWNLSWAKPALAVYLTVVFWYTGDFLISETRAYQVFTRDVISLAFLQVCFFLLLFRFFVTPFSRKLCEAPLRQRRKLNPSRRSIESGEVSQRLLKRLLIGLILVWLGIFLYGAALAGGLWPALIWPPLHHEKVGMYPLLRVGSGASFIFTSVGYIHLLICALFGVIAIMGRGAIRWIAAAMVLISWPYFWFDRYRSKMLALLLPGLAAFLFLGKRSLGLRVVAGTCFFLVLGAWFSKVMDFRAQGDFDAFSESASADEGDTMTRNASQGLDMLKELCWINTFIPSGRYQPNWGARYFAELVNPIPRALWAGKPMVGIDYALARGFGDRRFDAGVAATISTGMIGQGCVNFGRFFGVISAALLFALWAAFLARLWCQQASPFRLMLFMIGMGLTFNTGRDLSFLVLFPFVFGFMAVKIVERLRRSSREWSPPKHRTANQPSVPDTSAPAEP